MLPTRAGQRFLILFSALSVVAMVGMLFLGFFIGNRIADMRAPALAEAPPLSAPPRLELQLPPGASLSLDGHLRPETGAASLELEEGTLHVIKVELDGYHPMEIEVRMTQGEIRLLSFEAMSLQPKNNPP